MNASTNTGKEIRKSIETLIFDHLTFVDVLGQIRRRVQDTLEGFNPYRYTQL